MGRITVLHTSPELLRKSEAHRLVTYTARLSAIHRACAQVHGVMGPNSRQVGLSSYESLPGSRKGSCKTLSRRSPHSPSCGSGTCMSYTSVIRLGIVEPQRLIR